MSAIWPRRSRFRWPLPPSTSRCWSAPGLVKRSVLGRTHICRLDARPMHAGVEWLRHYEQFWQQRIDVLEALLEAEDAAKAKPRKSPGKKS